MLVISDLSWPKIKNTFVGMPFLKKGWVVARCSIEKKIVENAWKLADLLVCFRKSSYLCTAKSKSCVLFYGYKP